MASPRPAGRWRKRYKRATRAAKPGAPYPLIGPTEPPRESRFPGRFSGYCPPGAFLLVANGPRRRRRRSRGRCTGLPSSPISNLLPPACMMAGISIPFARAKSCAIPIRHPWLETPSSPAAFAAARMRTWIWLALKRKTGARCLRRRGVSGRGRRRWPGRGRRWCRHPSSGGGGLRGQTMPNSLAAIARMSAARKPRIHRSSDRKVPISR